MVTNLLLGLLAVFLHEAAHVVAALLLGIHVRRVGFSRKGLYIVREAGPPLANLIITLAGPALNLLLAIISPMSRQFALVNLVLGFCNLLPVAGSDGFRAWALLTGRRQACTTISVS